MVLSPDCMEDFDAAKLGYFDRVLLILALFREAGEGGRTQHRTTNRKKESFTADSLNYKTQPVTGLCRVSHKVTQNWRTEPIPFDILIVNDGGIEIRDDNSQSSSMTPIHKRAARMPIRAHQQYS